MAEARDQTELDLEIPEDDEKSTEEVEIEVADGEEEPEEPSSKVLSAEDGIAELKQKLEYERQARQEAERRAHEAANQAYYATNEVEDVNLHLVRNAIDTVRRDNDILRMNYSEALSVGDYDKAAEIQQFMSDNLIKLNQLEAGRSSMENREKSPPPPPPKPVAPEDPVEALTATLSPRSADWVRRHPEYARDDKMLNQMISAHNLVVSRGYEPDTDDYFNAVERVLEIEPRRQNVSHETDEDATSMAAKPVQRRSAPPAAPVSRSGNGTGSRPNVVRLTADQREMAQMMGMDEKEYAKHMVALRKEGKIH